MEKDLIIKNSLRELLLNIYNEYRKEYGENIARNEVAEIVAIVVDGVSAKKQQYSISQDFQRLKQFAQKEVQNAYEYLLENRNKGDLQNDIIKIFADIIGKKKSV